MLRNMVWAAVAALALSSSPLWADYDAGRKAWNAGNPAQALSEWRTAANAGDRRAMLALGRLYARGLGAPQNYVLAHVWLNLAASRGELAAVKDRDAIEAKLMPAERAEAQKRAQGLGERVERGERLARKYPPGRRLRDCDECPELVAVPRGSYRMGPSLSVHRVVIGEPFAVGMYEVTFDEWEACVRGGGCNGYRPDDEGWGRGRRPVVNVDWGDAKAYVEWLSRETGKEYRLLSESEWEYVARGGSRTRYHWGDSIRQNRANCNGCGSRWDNERTAPVGSFGANGFGLYDVHGNVWEWVEDCWNDDYVGAPSDGSAWESGQCRRRVLRGGSWSYIPWLLRSANRNWLASGIRFNNVGFRVARTLTL